MMSFSREEWKMSYLDESDKEYIQEMKSYIDHLKQKYDNSPENAAIEAKEALIRTGVLESDGSPKKSIVSWG